ncbi:hypothetical protein C8D94_102251 [Marinirhabdus gelatinilytica]|uniref:Uncharacterized protein n=1 Tax=Marinirhabdus gelatinilytica TaxID=1703343 RepID=A0A370QFD3_9FLAO|nr:hypothetical protein C8D94_102251 [Marinirhabdus gelatinilytica]
MNTLISIVMAIVLNILGVEVQERQLASKTQTEITTQQHKHCDSISATMKDTITASSIKTEHKCKLSK